MTGQADIAKLLLEHKAHVDYREKLVIISTLHTYNMSEAPIVVLSYQLLCGCLSQVGWSALHRASQYGNTETVLVLLEYGAQVDILSDVRVHKDDI